MVQLTKYCLSGETISLLLTKREYNDSVKVAPNGMI